MEKIVVTVARMMDCSEKGCCWIFATRIAKRLVAAGIADFTIVLGWVWCTSGRKQHIWLEYRGQKYDPTKAQFTDFLRYHHRIKQRLKPKEYLALPRFFVQ